MNITKNEISKTRHNYGVNPDLVGTGYFEIGKYDEAGLNCMRVTFSAEQFKETNKKLRNYYEYFNNKEHYYLTAINNLLRQTNFLELFQQFIEKQINEEEFNNELEKYPHRYIVSIENIEDSKIQADISIILNIFNNIDSDVKELTVNEVSELFSIDSAKLLESSTRFVNEDKLLTL